MILLRFMAAASAAALLSMPMPGHAAGGGASAFNPAISLVLAGTYAHLSEDPATWRIGGFMPNDGEVGPGERSFTLGESELTLAASVDPWFQASVTFAVSGDNEIGVEEAYFRTTALPRGFSAKGGRFLSGMGYLNEAHAHTWDFIDQPLVYQAMYGAQLGQDGLQLKWLAPTDLFVEFGLEAGNGAAFPATRGHGNGLRSVVGFAHVGGDVGDSTSWRAGASWLDARAGGRSYDDEAEDGSLIVHAFSGSSRTWMLDGVVKWAPRGDATRQQLKLQGEYMRRRESGALSSDFLAEGLPDSYRSVQSGWYLQGVYQFRPRWRIGARYDALESGQPRIGLVEAGAVPMSAFPALLPATPARLTLMIDWNPSEFSRLRLQYALDESRPEGRDRQLFLQYLFGIGAHAAHKF